VFFSINKKLKKLNLQGFDIFDGFKEVAKLKEPTYAYNYYDYNKYCDDGSVLMANGEKWTYNKSYRLDEDDMGIAGFTKKYISSMIARRLGILK